MDIFNDLLAYVNYVVKIAPFDSTFSFDQKLTQAFRGNIASCRMHTPLFPTAVQTVPMGTISHYEKKIIGGLAYAIPFQLFPATAPNQNNTTKIGGVRFFPGLVS